MTTALDIITKAMQKSGILTKTEMPSSDEANDALDSLNAMLSSWSNDSMLIVARVLESFPLVSGTATYTMGPSGGFATIRPMEIIEAHVRQSTIDYHLDPLTDETYQGAVWDKSTQGLPQFINCTNGYPNVTLNIWPVPSGAYTLFVLSEKELTSFTNLDQVVSLPPGWEQALVYNLAVLIAPEYGQPLDQSLVQIAIDSKGSIERAILRSRSMDAQDSVVRSRWNIYSGFY